MEEGSDNLRKPKKHSFFKVLIGDYATKLRIPVVFVYRFRSVIPKKVTLKASSNKCWRVDIEEEDDKELYFKTGWKTFVEDNGLENGEFIVFKYDGNSTFKVKMYGKSACEKEIQMGTDDQNYNYFDVADAGIENQKEKKTPIPQENHRERNPVGQNRQKWKQDDEIKKEKADSDDLGDINKRTAKKEADDEEIKEVIVIEPDDLIRKTGMYEKPMQRAFNEGSKLDSKNHPSFRILLKHAYAEKGTLCIPTEFFKQHMMNKKQNVEIETIKGAWIVTLIPHTIRNKTYARFSAGWTDCARGNHFRTGDTLIFKMIHRSNNCPKFIVRKLSQKAMT